MVEFSFRDDLSAPIPRQSVVHAFPILLQGQGCEPYNNLHILLCVFTSLQGSVLQNPPCVQTCLDGCSLPHLFSLPSGQEM